MNTERCQGCGRMGVDCEAKNRPCCPDCKHDLVSGLQSQVAALRETILKYCRHGHYCRFSQAVPAEEEELHQCTCGLTDALSSTADAAKAWEAKVKREAYEEAAKMAELYIHPAHPLAGSRVIERQAETAIQIAAAIRGLGEKKG